MAKGLPPVPNSLNWVELRRFLQGIRDALSGSKAFDEALAEVAKENNSQASKIESQADMMSRFERQYRALVKIVDSLVNQIIPLVYEGVVNSTGGLEGGSIAGITTFKVSDGLYRIVFDDAIISAESSVLVAVQTEDSIYRYIGYEIDSTDFINVRVWVDDETIEVTQDETSPYKVQNAKMNRSPVDAGFSFRIVPN